VLWEQRPREKEPQRTGTSIDEDSLVCMSKGSARRSGGNFPTGWRSLRRTCGSI
jgi:hypothetical protein